MTLELYETMRRTTPEVSCALLLPVIDVEYINQEKLTIKIDGKYLWWYPGFCCQSRSLGIYCGLVRWNCGHSSLWKRSFGGDGMGYQWSTARIVGRGDYKTTLPESYSQQHSHPLYCWIPLASRAEEPSGRPIGIYEFVSRVLEAWMSHTMDWRSNDMRTELQDDE